MEPRFINNTDFIPEPNTSGFVWIDETLYVIEDGKLFIVEDERVKRVFRNLNDPVFE